MIDPSAFSSITGQIDYGRKRMPLTDKGEKVMKNMQSQYGAEKGKEVFYASANKGTITGVHEGLEGVAATLALKESQMKRALEQAGGDAMGKAYGGASMAADDRSAQARRLRDEVLASMHNQQKENMVGAGDNGKAFTGTSGGDYIQPAPDAKAKMF